MELGHQVEMDPDLDFGQVNVLEFVLRYCFMFNSDAAGAATGGMLGYLFGNRGK